MPAMQSKCPPPLRPLGCPIINSFAINVLPSANVTLDNVKIERQFYLSASHCIMDLMYKVIPTITLIDTEVDDAISGVLKSSTKGFFFVVGTSLSTEVHGTSQLVRSMLRNKFYTSVWINLTRPPQDLKFDYTILGEAQGITSQLFNISKRAHSTNGRPTTRSKPASLKKRFEDQESNKTRMTTYSPHKTIYKHSPEWRKRNNDYQKKYRSLNKN